MDKKQILIIEDSLTQARYSSFILEDAGYQTTIANTGQKGLELATTTFFDLVLLDVILPDTDGFKVCSQLRQKTSSYVPILMLTAQKLTVEDKVDGLTAGADDYLSKPFDPRELIARVCALLRIKQMIDDMFANLNNEHQAYQSLKRIALIDHLTGLYNRHYFSEALEREYGLAHRHNLPLSCIMTDIDHFRDFNNQYGHAMGDIVLQGVARLMQENLRQGDIIARFGGEEFVILLNMTSLEMASVLAERLRLMVDKHVWESPVGKLHITISFGVAALPSPLIMTSEHLVQCADKALYKAKSSGRNRVEVFNPENDANVPLMDKDAFF